MRKQRGTEYQRHAGHVCCIWRRAFSTFAISFLVGAALRSTLNVVHLQHTHTRLTAIKVDEVDPPAVADKITNSASTTTTTNNTDSKEEFARYNPQLVQAPPDSSITYQDMDAMCTLKRYPPRLFGKFCPVDRPSCYLKAFRAYFQARSARENLVGGCPLNEAVCYAKRNRELLDEYCNGSETKCDYYSLRDHYEQHGMKEKRAWGCDF